MHYWRRRTSRSLTIESTTATTIADEETTFEEGVLEFAQCMREEGINFPDPTFDIDGNPQFDNLEIENEEEFESAFENCEDILRNALPEQFDLDPEVEAALVDAFRIFSMHEGSRYRFSRSKTWRIWFLLLLEMQILTLVLKQFKRLLKSANLKTHWRIWTISN